MKATIIGQTHSDFYQSSDMLANFKKFAGAQAGICYMSDKYFGTYVTDPEKALKRFDTVIATGHHSIADHVQVTILLEEVPKIVAMYLNNLSSYATSEKSGRYTQMTGNTEIETHLYTKWCDVFKTRIVEVYGDKIDARTVDKLAKENARYLLSVFTPTTMSYTTSIRQWNYILDWLDSFDYSQFVPGYFVSSLSSSFKELRRELEGVHIPILRDTKGRGLNLVNNARVCAAKNQFGESYATTYTGSFAELAQAQRHRTLKYNIAFDGKPGAFYIPPIIKGTELEALWVKDMKQVSEYVPQGTLVKILERGDVEDFLLKCKERLCGRAQIEIAKQTAETLELLHSHIEEFPTYVAGEIVKYVRPSGKCKAKCELLKCKEPCVWGSRDAISRLI